MIWKNLMQKILLMQLYNGGKKMEEKVEAKTQINPEKKSKTSTIIFSCSSNNRIYCFKGTIFRIARDRRKLYFCFLAKSYI
mgnify:CR=1 FL=1